MAGGRPGRPPGRPRGSGRARGSGRPSGRPRRYSNSTVASIDLSHVTYLQEASVLKSTKSTDSDDWDTFELKEAVVYRKSNDGQLVIANVCNVDFEGPFVIRGKLNIDLSDQKEFCTLLLPAVDPLVCRYRCASLTDSNYSAELRV